MNQLALRIIYLFLTLLWLSAAAVSLVDDLVGAIGFRAQEWPLRVLSALVAGAAFYAGCITRRAFTRPSSVKDAQVLQSGRIVPDDEILRLANEIWSRFDRLEIKGGTVAATIETFTELLFDGSHVIEAQEDVHLDSDSLTCKIALEVAVPAALSSAGRKRNLVPVITSKQPKFESVQILDREGNRLSSLTREEATGLLVWSLNSIFRLAYKSNPKEEFTREEHRAFWAVVRAACRTDELAADVAKKDYYLAVSQLRPHDQSLSEKLAGVVQTFAANQIMVVDADVETSRIYITYVEELPPYDRLITHHDKARTIVGLRPFRYRIPLNLPFYAKRYKFRITGPIGQFIYQHYLRTCEDNPRIVRDTAEIFAVPDAKQGLQDDVALPATTLWTENLNQATDPVPLECVVEFEEIPPGALGRTAMISTVCTLLIFAFAFALPGSLDGNGAGSDLAALMLASPLFAASWVGQSVERVQLSSLTTYAGLTVSGGLSLVSAILYVVQSATWEAVPVNGMSLLGVVSVPPFDIVWMALGVVATANTVHLTIKARQRMGRYLRALRGRQTDALRSGA